MDYFRRLGNFWFPDVMAIAWLLFALPALYFFQTTIHEGSHAMAAFTVTGSFPKLAPFPHSTADGGFLNGVTLGDSSTVVSVVERQSCDSPAKTRFTRLAGFPATPQFLDLVLIVIFTFIFIFTSTRDPVLRLFLRAWYLGAIIDFMYNTIRGLIGGCNPSTDWSKFMLGSDISPAVFAVMTWIFWLAILSHFIWVNWSKWGRDPVTTSGWWDYRWFAFVLGLLSLAAVLLSFLVSDPQINKFSVAFIFPLVVQIGALIWYWVYFGLTFRFKS